MLPRVVAPKRQEKGNVVSGGLEVVGGADDPGQAGAFEADCSDARASRKVVVLTWFGLAETRWDSEHVGHESVSAVSRVPPDAHHDPGRHNPAWKISSARRRGPRPCPPPSANVSFGASFGASRVARGRNSGYNPPVAAVGLDFRA